jgi:transposase
VTSSYLEGTHNALAAFGYNRDGKRGKMLCDEQGNALFIEEIRPVYVQLEASTRGHALVVMLAHRLIKELEQCWSGQDLKVEEGLKQLSTLCVTDVVVGGEAKDELVPEPRAQIKKLFDLAGVKLPKRIRSRGVVVSTRKKLVDHRPRRSK